MKSGGSYQVIAKSMNFYDFVKLIEAPSSLFVEAQMAARLFLELR